MNQTAARKARPKSEEVDYEDDSDAELDQEEGDDVVNTPSHRTRARAAVARGRAPEDPELAGAPRRGARSRRATQKAREADSLESDEEDEDDSQDEEERTSPKWSRFMGVYVLPLAEARKKRLQELGKSASPDKDTDHHGQGPVINVGSDEDAEGEEDEAEGENGWGGLGA